MITAQKARGSCPPWGEGLAAEPLEAIFSAWPQRCLEKMPSGKAVSLRAGLQEACLRLTAPVFCVPSPSAVGDPGIASNGGHPLLEVRAGLGGPQFLHLVDT